MPEPTPGPTGEQGKGTPTPGATGGSGNSDAGTSGGQDSIQKAIDAVIRRERADAAEKLAEKDREIATLKNPPKPAGDVLPTPKAGDEEYAKAARAPLEIELAAEREKSRTRDERVLRSEIKSIAAELSVDPDEVAVQLIRDKRVKLSDADGVEVIDKDGRPEYGAKGIKTATDAVRELLARKPYLAKASVRDGLQLGDPKRNTSAGGETVESLKAAIAEHDGKKEFAKSAILKQRLTEALRPR